MSKFTFRDKSSVTKISFKLKFNCTFLHKNMNVEEFLTIKTFYFEKIFQKNSNYFITSFFQFTYRPKLQIIQEISWAHCLLQSSILRGGRMKISHKLIVCGAGHLHASPHWWGAHRTNIYSNFYMYLGIYIRPKYIDSS